MPQLPSAQDTSSPVETLSAAQDFAVGQWYWVKDTDSKGVVSERLACVTEIGTNFVGLSAPTRHGTMEWRIHYTDYHTQLRFEPNAAAAIAERVAHYQGVIAGAMDQVKAITARLGINPQARLATPTQAETQALAVVSSAADPKQYEKALITAQKEELPALFKQIEDASAYLTKWMQAELLPLQATTAELKGSMQLISSRILNVSLYAGLTEDVVQCRDGASAAFHDKLHVLQRRLYMDEESYAGYHLGGIDIAEIGMFDRFLCMEENFTRIFPFPRTMVAFRVRRTAKEREWDGSLNSLFVNINLRDHDNRTFLYIRNGEQLYRLECDQEFGERIFPNPEELNLNEPMMMRDHYREWQFITVREWEVRQQEGKERQKRYAEWNASHSKEDHWKNPHGGSHDFCRHKWELFSEDSVYFDDASKYLANQALKYNRIALIIQGLFDRSECLHPHPPVKTWTPEGFDAAVRLVYDGGQVLHDGDPPDFIAYIAECNAKITKDSVLWGQDLYWQKKEAEKENERRDRDYRFANNPHRPKYYKPYGNRGPGELAIPYEWKPRAKEAVFTWTRERLRPPATRWDPSGPIRTTITVPVTELFNVSAYRPGDYKRFFADSRTRQQYLKWGPMLIAAEEYHAGNSRMPVQEPFKG